MSEHSAGYALDVVGSKVIIVGRYVPGGQTEATVTKVARKWATAERSGSWQNWQYDKATGAGKPTRDGFSAGFSAYTPDTWERHQLRGELTERLRKATSGWNWMNDLSNEQIAALLAVITPDEETAS